MEVVSVNIGKKQILQWRSKLVETGIIKKEITKPIFLAKTDVNDDDVVDKKNHGGLDKAVYAFSKNHYNYFKKWYPNIEFYNGIFGENITVTNLFETNVNIGDVYQIGTATVQVSQPRIPCFKLGIVFNDQQIVKQFLHSTYSGIYFRIINEGYVSKGDQITLIKRASDSLTVADVFSIYSYNSKNRELINKALTLKFLPVDLKNRLQKRISND